MNFYAVLGIPRDADEASIRAAYRVLARRYHPDRGAGSCAEKFRQVTEAYETLIDPRTRHAYDLSLPWAEPPEPVRVPPMASPFGPYPQEDATVHGAFSARPMTPAFLEPVGIDEVLERWLRSFDDLFFDPERRW